MARLRAEEREYVDEMTKIVNDFVFQLFDAEIGISASEAGRIARQADKGVEKELVKLIKK